MYKGFMKRLVPTLGGVSAMLVLAAALGGCEPAQSRGGVAIVDLDAVAKATGRDTAMAGQVQAFASEQETKLQALKKELQAKVAEATKALGENPSPADKEKLVSTITSARNELNRQVAEARQAAQELRNKLVREFAQEIQPVARRAAEQRGTTVVMVKQPGLLVVMPEADITGAVIDALQADPRPVAPPLPAPTNPE